ncbi:hypothetical protein ABGB17_10525 [Sphaerisporangium sp. B11E5]|uniref:hypothetical protein n=1 Tax=Sphaerisporangium sp. B11E5 TaxID=3153563 RepID=UPI00325CDB30
MINRHARASLPKRVLLHSAAASLAAVPGLALGGPADAQARPAAVSQPRPACMVGNGGFEAPGPLLGPGNMRTDVPDWRTTSADGVIELWGPGNAGANGGLEVPADSGRQFAEVNGTQVSTLYQDVATQPRTILVWRLAHRARSTTKEQRDVIRVRIGAPGGTTAQIPLGQITPDIADGGTEWGHYVGLYRVPRGQRVTRIAIESVSSVGGPTYGNFVDSVSVACTRPCPKLRPPHRGCDILGIPLPSPGPHPAAPGVLPPPAVPPPPAGAPRPRTGSTRG